MKIRCQWKDPDFTVDVEDQPKIDEFYKLPDDIQRLMRKMGATEYVQIEFDTETLKGTVLRSW